MKCVLRVRGIAVRDEEMTCAEFLGIMVTLFSSPGAPFRLSVGRLRAFKKHHKECDGCQEFWRQKYIEKVMGEMKRRVLEEEV